MCKATVHTEKKVVPSPAPFTLEDLKKAIPAHCFERSAIKHGAYLALDLAVVSTLFYVAYFYLSALPWYLGVFAWPLYWAVQGCVLTGVWVIAHECGHQAFSESKALNDSIGLVLHSFLLVPYHSWRISHGKHHACTGSVEHDEVFVPPLKSECPEKMPSKLAVLVHLFVMEIFGWPAYLAANITGPAKYRGKKNSHFTPESAIFLEKDKADIQLSVAAFGVMVAAIVAFTLTHSVSFMVQIYLIPLLIVNFWLVTITYLQHTDMTLPHYRGREWNWLRGALATVDRDYGILNHVFHRITDTHVVHHLFSKMPFYHAAEATEAVKKVLGNHYCYDSTPILKALWTNLNKCQYIDDHGDVVFFSNQELDAGKAK